MKLLDYMRKSGNALGAVFNAVFLLSVAVCIPNIPGERSVFRN